jgi:DNA ligase (NAD+)
VAAGAEALRAAVAELRGAGEAGGFPTDGVVIKLEAVADQERLGEGPVAPRWAVARKFAPERAATRLRAITLQVGRSGVVTPVAELEPVELDGSTVARASLHNADEIARRDVRIGDRVWVEKAGEIIPAIVGVDRGRRAGTETAYVFPDTCPACAEALRREEGKAGHRCVNASCPARVARRLEHFASPDGLAISGLGPALIEALVAGGRVRSPADLYRLTEDGLREVPGVGARTAGKLRREIAASRERARRDGARLIFALGWPGVGREAAKRLARAFGGLPELARADEARLRRPVDEGGPGLGPAAAKELAAHLREPGVAAEVAEWAAVGVGDLWAGAAVVGASGGRLAGQVVVITGTLASGTRAEVAARLVAAGAKVATDVTRETTLLVAGAEPGVKLGEARKRGVAVIDEVELRRRLGDE